MHYEMHVHPVVMLVMAGAGDVLLLMMEKDEEVVVVERNRMLDVAVAIVVRHLLHCVPRNNDAID